MEKFNLKIKLEPFFSSCISKNNCKDIVPEVRINNFFYIQ